MYRYLRELRATGFVAERDAAYRPGERLIGKARTEPSRTELRRLAHSTLEELAAESGETALIAIRVGTHALCLDQVESAHAMRMAFRIGQTLPLHAGAASRVLLAHAPAEVAEVILRHLDRITPATPNRDSLSRRLAAVRSAGIATSRGEPIPGAVAIAVPIFDDGRCLSSLALAAPERRADGRWQRRAKELLGVARRDIEALV